MLQTNTLQITPEILNLIAQIDELKGVASGNGKNSTFRNSVDLTHEQNAR